MGECPSSPQDPPRRVAQGFIFSPLLLKVYMKLLGEIMWRFGVKCHQHADDTQLHLFFPSDPGPQVYTDNWMWGEPTETESGQD